MWIPELYETLAPHIETFMDEVLNYKLSSDDEVHLYTGHVELLSPDAKNAFDLFWNNYFLPLFKYTSVEQRNIQSSPK